MENQKALSARMVEFTVEENQKVSIPESDIIISGDTKKFDYYRIETYDGDVYRMPVKEMESKIEAIDNGAKLLKAGVDFVPVGQLKSIKKRSATKTTVEPESRELTPEQREAGLKKLEEIRKNFPNN